MKQCKTSRNFYKETLQSITKTTTKINKEPKKSISSLEDMYYFTNNTTLPRTTKGPSDTQQRKNKEIFNLEKIYKQFDLKPKEQDKLPEFREGSEVNVSNLSKWEKEKLKMSKLADTNVSHTEINKGLYLETESINYYNQVKNDFTSFKLKNKTQFQEFHKKSTEEQGTIFLQNINFSKKNFNFDVFKENSHSEIIPKEGKTQNRFSFLQKKEIGDKINTKQILNEQLNKVDILYNGNLEHLANKDGYRLIIREKVMLETHYRKEIHRLNNKIFELTNERSQMIIFNSASNKELMKSEVDFKILGECIGLEKRHLLDKFHEYSGQDTNKKHLIEDREHKILNIEYNKKIEKLDKSLINKRIDVNKRSQYLKKIIETNKVQIVEKQKQIKANKQLFNEFIKEQRIYYIDLLIKGFDVRNEGLVWIVRRLLDLSTKVESSLFPRFLDQIQIEYIMKVRIILSQIAMKQQSCSLLKYTLNILKVNHQVMNEENMENKMKFTEISDLTYTNNSSKLFFDPSKTNSNFNKSSFSKATIQSFEK